MALVGTPHIRSLSVFVFVAMLVPLHRHCLIYRLDFLDEVDEFLSHFISLAISSYMDDTNIFVASDDSVLGRSNSKAFFDWLVDGN